MVHNMECGKAGKHSAYRREILRAFRPYRKATKSHNTVRTNKRQSVDPIVSATVLSACLRRSFMIFFSYIPPFSELGVLFHISQLMALPTFASDWP